MNLTSRRERVLNENNQYEVSCYVTVRHGMFVKGGERTCTSLC